MLKTESVYPPFMTRQRLIWDDQGLEWRMRFPTRQYAYATVLLKAPLDLREIRDSMQLVFRLRPARMAPFLSIAALDRPEAAPPAISDVWLLERAPPGDDGWITIRIPLKAFPLAAVMEGDAPDANPATAPSRTPMYRELDWTRIQEFRFVSPGGRIPAEEIVVRDLRLQRL